MTGHIAGGERPHGHREDAEMSTGTGPGFLGYRRAEAFGAVAAASRRLGGEAKVDALIRAGLQELSQNSEARA